MLLNCAASCVECMALVVFTCAASFCLCSEKSYDDCCDMEQSKHSFQPNKAPHADYRAPARLSETHSIRTDFCLPVWGALAFAALQVFAGLTVAHIQTSSAILG